MDGKRVLLGMSGGVDSSVAAALLLRQGYTVVGVTLTLLGDGAPSADALDARRVADALGIEHIIADRREVFAREVLDRFSGAYFAGKTPNPCVLCNRFLKFGAMMELADELGCGRVATGHYARIGRDADGTYTLLRALDPKKDQSYVLYHLTQEKLRRILFPLADFDKEEIRALAGEWALPVAHKPDSQDICFVKDGDYVRFLREYTGRDLPPGDFIDEKGSPIGRHKGILHYTIGQRKGLGMSFGQHMFVSAIDAGKNTVTLVPAGKEMFSGLTAVDATFVSGVGPPQGARVGAMVRYQSAVQVGTLTRQGDEWKLDFDAPVRAVTPGQAVVFYDGDRVLGGATIRAGILLSAQTDEPFGGGTE